MNNRPNVLLIMTDQQRPDTMGFRRETPCRTPNIDRIAREGILFDHAIIPCPLCLPSRASLFTGVYPTQNDMMDAQVGYLDDCQMLDHFRGAGYQINYAGKWHMGEGNIGDFTDRHAGDSTPEYSKWSASDGGHTKPEKKQGAMCSLLGDCCAFTCQAADYIEMFYNPKRKHARNGMLSPAEFERQQKMKQEGV